ncbi:sn-glycerol-3-phosphate ABC transporter ATP-binding protein UgpC [Photobacterium gaetbulicola]|uniref:Inner membrane ABC transporter n=1 Tax=Photobacterium gaetbulicola Gung47 TaxID=658445 RepID=A0A0C5WQN3_9GAMM|nr:sn-glycerol-3-phosphate ABC transporter ATP-binding protein UgpC [Photobacterium gaetbulicola]AJR09478.1 inner membrane ABC transporter [Photobacterium gaetbulicola Gung47]PSU14272.1 sn-glycerol-3-phosphate ABC transporter ATP-binding protein UgpC [Photobacterium gaetbulicola]
MAKVILNDVCKTYDKTQTIHDVKLDIESGEFLVLVGPSGCGKSTLLRMIAGLEDVSSGRVHIDARDVTDVNASEREISMVFQSYALYPHMTVKENLAFGLKNIKMPTAEIESRISEAADILQLSELLNRRPQNLSGGQRQRVAIGRSIVQNPKVFLFDEPLSNLDAALRVQMRQELSKLHSKLKSTMIYVTHDQVEAMTLADRIVILRAGKIEQIGTPLEVYNQPANTFVAEFMGAPKINLLTAVAEKSSEGFDLVFEGQSRLSIAGSLSHLPPDNKVTLGIRPEHISIKAPSNEKTAMQATVTYSELLGDSTIVYLNYAGQEIRVKLASQEQLSVGDIFDLEIDSKYLNCFVNNMRVDIQ